MGLKVGDIIYCVDNNRTELLMDKPYTIQLYTFMLGFNFYKLENGKSYTQNRFITDKEYQINHRKEKLIKLKDGIKNRR